MSEPQRLPEPGQTTTQQPGLHQKLFDSRKSNLAKYRELMVGDRGLLALFRLELASLLLAPIPGALGLALRRAFYRPLFQQFGRNVALGQNLALRHPHKIRLGSDIAIDDYCLLDAKGESNSGIAIGDGFTMGRFSSLVCKDGDIVIGSHVNLGSSVKLIVASGGRIQIADSIDIGSSCHFSASSYDYSESSLLPSTQRRRTRGIVIHELAWIGAGVVILDGVIIGARSIVGAGSVVNADVPEGTIVAGVPAKVVRERD